MLKVYYHIEIFKGQNEQWFWRIRSYNNNILATSEGYETKQSATEVAEKLQSHLEFSIIQVVL